MIPNSVNEVYLLVQWDLKPKNIMLQKYFELPVDDGWMKINKLERHKRALSNWRKTEFSRTL